MKKILFILSFSILLPGIALAAPQGTPSGPHPAVNSAALSATPGFVWGFYEGAYLLTFHCTSGCSGDYPHSFLPGSYDEKSGGFTATGFYNPDHSITWDASGTIAGNAITMLIVYTGEYPGYTVSLTGQIQGDGTLSGTATSSAGQSFTWDMNRKARPILTSLKVNGCDAFTKWSDVSRTFAEKSARKSFLAPDAGSDGHIWAMDTLTRSVKVWQIGTSTNEGLNTYCAVIHDYGTYQVPDTVTTTTPEVSPNTTGHIDRTIIGGIFGGYVFSFTSRGPNGNTSVNNWWDPVSDLFISPNENAPSWQGWIYGYQDHLQQWVDIVTPGFIYGDITTAP